MSQRGKVSGELNCGKYMTGFRRHPNEVFSHSRRTLDRQIGHGHGDAIYILPYGTPVYNRLGSLLNRSSWWLIPFGHAARSGTSLLEKRSRPLHEEKDCGTVKINSVRGCISRSISGRKCSKAQWNPTQ